MTKVHNKQIAKGHKVEAWDKTPTDPYRAMFKHTFTEIGADFSYDLSLMEITNMIGVLQLAKDGIIGRKV